jgi:hypothetical protein
MTLIRCWPRDPDHRRGCHLHTTEKKRGRIKPENRKRKKITEKEKKNKIKIENKLTHGRERQNMKQE